MLRGPQGTLFGRNSTAGVIHYVTRKPGNEFEGELSAQYGSYNQVILQAAAGGAVTDGLRARFAVKYNRDDGFQKSTVTGSRFGKTDAVAGRVILQADISPSIQVETKLAYSHNEGQTAIHGCRSLRHPDHP